MAHRLSDPCRCGHAHIEYASIDFSEVDVAGERISKWCVDPVCPCYEYIKEKTDDQDRRTGGG